MTEAERFRVFVHILDPEDYLFLRSRDAGAEREFRRKRVRIYRHELRAITADLARLHRTRASNIAAAARWGTYPSLALETMSGFLSIGKLFAAGVLFAWRLPVVIDAARNADRLLRFVNSQTIAPAPSDLPA